MLTPRWIIAKNRTKDVKAMNEPQIQFLYRAPAGYSHVVEVRGGRTLYISGQIAVDSSGNVVGSGDFNAQVKQVFANLKACLDEAGASFNDVVKLNFYLVDAENLQHLRTQAMQLFPEKMHLYDRIYESRFRRLREQFRNSSNNLDAENRS